MVRSISRDTWDKRCRSAVDKSFITSANELMQDPHRLTPRKIQEKVLPVNRATNIKDIISERYFFWSQASASESTAVNVSTAARVDGVFFKL